jgi:hypothetical protein
VLFGVKDAIYKFLYVNFGCRIRVSDEGVFRSTDFQTLMEDYSLNFHRNMLFVRIDS